MKTRTEDSDDWGMDTVPDEDFEIRGAGHPEIRGGLWGGLKIGAGPPRAPTLDPPLDG